MTEYKAHTHEEILSAFQSRFAKLSAVTSFKYRKTLSEFDWFLTAHRMTLADLTAVTISDWVVELLRQGLSLATIAQRLNILNSLFKATSAKSLISPCIEPRDIVRKLESQEFVLPPLLKTTVFDKTLSLLRGFAKDRQEHSLSRDIILFSVLNGAKPLEEIIYLTKENLTNYTGYSKRILERNINGRRKFIFDLKQSYLTTRQIVSSITEELRLSFGRILASDSINFDELTSSLWVALAMRCGATASDTISSVSSPATYTIPDFCAASENTHKSRDLWMNAVESLLIRDLPKWYAMRLRKGVRFDEFRKEIHDRIHPVPELFYPVESMKKQLRGKTTIIEQPFISQTVFFKSYPEDVLPLFAQIGDKAWCIRVTNNSDAPYAVIPQNDMQRFQRAIGVFSSDAELYPLGSLAPRPGEKVILIQAGYSNREAEVENVLECDCRTTLFRVRLTTDYGYEWRTTVDARQIERIIKTN